MSLMSDFLIKHTSSISVIYVMTPGIDTQIMLLSTKYFCGLDILRTFRDWISSLSQLFYIVWKVIPVQW